MFLSVACEWPPDSCFPTVSCKISSSLIPNYAVETSLLVRCWDALALPARRGRNVILYLCISERRRRVLGLTWDTMIKLLLSRQMVLCTLIWFHPWRRCNFRKQALLSLPTSMLQTFDILWYERGRLDSGGAAGRSTDSTRQNGELKRLAPSQRSNPLVADVLSEANEPRPCTHQPVCTGVSVSLMDILMGFFLSGKTVPWRIQCESSETSVVSYFFLSMELFLCPERSKISSQLAVWSFMLG